MAQYETLGHYYDALVKDEQASQDWVEWIESFQPGENFLELACGSGEITERLALNHQMTALDLSASMLEEARKKDLAGKIRFLHQDMRDLSSLGCFDAIGCFCDSFNYLIEAEEVQNFFKEIHDHLVSGGLFLFDSHGQARLDEFAQDYEETGQFEDGTQVQWIISASEDLIYQDFAFYFPDRTVLEHHLQRVYSPALLQQWLEEAGFEVIDVRGDFGWEPLETCEKYFFACRKKDKPHDLPVDGKSWLESSCASKMPSASSKQKNN